MIRHFSATPKRILALLMTGAAVALIASTASAVIPDSSGAIHACYALDGTLRVIDTDAGGVCKKNERPLDWSTAPAAELPDSFVALRRSGMSVPATNTFTQVAKLDLQPGRYQVTAKAMVSSQGTALDNPVSVFCSLIPSNVDGTPGSPGLASDSMTLHLAPVSQPGERGESVLFVSQELAQPGSVVLGCSATGNDQGVDVRDVSIRAIEVGSITTDPGPGPLP